MPSWSGCCTRDTGTQRGCIGTTASHAQTEHTIEHYVQENIEKVCGIMGREI
jgi:hypothetical protein